MRAHHEIPGTPTSRHRSHFIAAGPDDSPTEQQQAAAAAAAAAAAVRLPDFHADSPQSWFTNLDSQFATANITQSLTKFHWAVAKLPFSLNPTYVHLIFNSTHPLSNYLQSLAAKINS